MGSYVVVSLAADAPAQTERFQSLRQTALTAGFRVVDLSARTWVVLSGPNTFATLSVGPWTLIGEVHHRARAPVRRVSDDDPVAYEKKLIARFWGRYVGLRLDKDGSVASILRDPSGALDCIYWQAGPLTFVVPELPDDLPVVRKPAWSIDVARVEAALHDPYSTVGALLLDGPSTLDPGTLIDVVSGETTVLWRPDWIYRHAPTLTDEAAAERLRLAVEEAVQALAGTGESLAVEVSGGLDSSIVASTVARTHRDKVRLWLNAWGPDPSADERAWIDILAHHLTLSASCVPRAVGHVTKAFLTDMPQGFRPGLAALDGLLDQDWARRFRAAGIDRVLTGKGGDGLFIQPADIGVFVDLRRERGWRAVFTRDLVRLAAWNERSVWTFADAALRRDWSPDAIDVPNGLLAPRRFAPRDRHPWLQDIDDLGPAKRRQILGLVQGVGMHGPSLQTRAADICHPLLTQPVVEACLALPTPQLTLGRRDRALARLVFQDRLPAALLDRRSKGEMTAFYGRMIAGGLDILRPWLLEGRLSAMGLIDRTSAETLLTRESLAWRGGYVDIMVTAAIEGWVRSWERRLRAH